MKKSKSSSSSKRRKRSPSVERKRGASAECRRKRSRARSRSPSSNGRKLREGAKVLPRKTRWHTSKTPDRENPPKKIASSDTSQKKEDSSQEPPLRIKDLLDDKEKIVEHLFLTITGAALEELIPDYLKNRSTGELKKLCLEQVKCMSKELILKLISGEDISLFDNPETQKAGKEKDVNIKHQKPESQKKEKEDVNIEHQNVPVDTVKEEVKTPQPSQKNLPAVPAPDDNENLSSDVLELFATSKEMEGIIDEENQVPSATEKEVPQEPPGLESDAELLELEMRARAIRSLLKARCHVMSTTKEKEDVKSEETKK